VNDLTFTLTNDSKDRLLRELDDACKKGIRKRVKEWQQIAGWINWVLNVHPLLRPALNNVYAKLRGKEQNAKVWANLAIQEDFVWARTKLNESTGVFLLKSLSWETNEATRMIKTRLSTGRAGGPWP
jgi:hypothetical protein